jgi:hypothetical protein
VKCELGCIIQDICNMDLHMQYTHPETNLKYLEQEAEDDED